MNEIPEHQRTDITELQIRVKALDALVLSIIVALANRDEAMAVEIIGSVSDIAGVAVSKGRADAGNMDALELIQGAIDDIVNELSSQIRRN